MMSSGQLTYREYQILTLVSEGKQNKEIAKDLSIAESTVEKHLRQLYTKLKVKNRTEAAIFYLKTSKEK